MLKKLYLAPVLVALIFASCSKDEDDNLGERIAGVWKNIEFTYTDCTDPDDDEVITLSTDCDNVECHTYTFGENGSLDIELIELGMVEEMSSGTWSGDEDDVRLCVSGDCEDGFIEFEGDDRMIMTFPETEEGCKIILTFIR